MPVEKGLLLVCGKTGRVVGLNRRYRWARWFFPITVLGALIWYLARVIPKPSRAAYPCQRVAAPVAFGGLAYILSIIGLATAFRNGRRFLYQHRYAAAGGCLAVGMVSAAVVIKNNVTNASAASTDTPNAPIGIARGINPGRVVWSYDPAVCSWSGSKDGTHWWDPNKADQARVDAMLSSALRSLTTTTNDADAWDALFRSFNQRRGNGNLSYAQSPRRSIAIKINQNPCNTPNTNYYALNGVIGAGDNEYSITGNPHLILALIKQLVAVQVAQSNILVCDASGKNRGWGGPRTIGDNIYQYIHPLYPGVRFVDGVGLQGRELATWASTNHIVYPLNASSETTSRGLQICQQILAAGFFINLAILKDHDDGPTLCGKNNYGSISGQRHGPIYGNSTPTYYSNLVPLMGHPELGEKTLLFMIDALYGAPSPNVMPAKWKMTPFNTNWPNSVFLSQDGVAIDSVGFDFLNAEWGQPQNTDYYLHEAAHVPGANGVKLSGVAYQPAAGSAAFVGSLGTQEHWNNSTGKQYSRNLGTGSGIELVKLVPGVPSVSLAGLGAGSFFMGTNLPIRAVVINNTNPISQVAFLQGTQLLGTSSGSYCGITWSNVPAGNYLLKAVATDSLGLSYTSNPVNITVVGATYTWDANLALAGAQDGGGTWSLTASNWWNGTNNVAWQNSAPPTTTILGVTNAAAGTITLAANITAANLIFQPAGSGNYTIAGAGYALTLTGLPVVSVASNCSPVISASVAGAGFAKTNPGTLTLSGSNTYGGTLSVSGGTLVLLGNNFGSTAGATVTSGATLRLAEPNALQGALGLNNGSTLQLRADTNATFAPSGITLEAAANTLNLDVSNLTAGVTGRTLTLAGTLAFSSSSDQTINVTGNSTYTLGLGAITATASSHNPYRLVNLNAVPGIGAVMASFTAGNYGAILNLAGGGKTTIAGNLGNTSNGSVWLFVNNGTTATLQGVTAKSNAGDAYRYFVPNGTLVVDNSGALTNNTTGTGLNSSLFILGAATNIVGSGYSVPTGFLIATNNAYNCVVCLGDAQFSSGGITLRETVTNYVSDGDVGFTNSGTMTIGGQNTSGTNTFANPIILGWTPHRGKSVTLLAESGGTVDFVGGLLRNGTDTTAGLTVGDATHTGVIRLAGANTYIGTTRNNAGTLLVNGSIATGPVIAAGGVLGGSGTINGPVTLQSGATLSPGPGIGTLTINSHLTLAGDVLIEIKKSFSPSNDLVTVSGVLTNAGGGVLTITNLGPSLAAGDRFRVFSKALLNGGALTLNPATPGWGLAWANNLAVDGSLGVLPVATNPAPVLVSFNDGSLTLSWPADHIGWTLQVKTSLGNVGPGTNWITLPASTATNRIVIPVGPTAPSAFYRLKYP